jgi:hypothetical protein
MIQDLRRGDPIIGSHGVPVTVTGTYPQGIRETYWIEFCDGCGVEVSDHHLWLVHETSTDALPSVMSTLDLFHRARSLEEKNEIGMRLGRIPVVRPVQFFSENLDHKIDPYTLGVFLSAFDSSRCGKLSVTFPSADLDHFKKSLKLGSHGWSHCETKDSVELTVDESFRTCMSEFLTPVSESHTVRIPSELKMAVVSQRVAFLQGLLDISPAKNGTIAELGTSLRRDVTDIVRSVGGLAYQGNGKGSSDLCLTLRLETGLIPFLSPSKQRSGAQGSISAPQRYIVKIFPLRQTEVICISVDAADRLYVTENVSCPLSFVTSHQTRQFIVTHNTIQSIALLLSNRPGDDPKLLSEWERYSVWCFSL